MKVTRIFYDKALLPDGAVAEVTIYQLPRVTPERPYGSKYSLFYGYDVQRVVSYDNERGNGDHKHIGALVLLCHKRSLVLGLPQHGHCPRRAIRW